MIAVAVLFLLSSLRAQNVWARDGLPKDTSVRISKSISSNLAWILNLLGKQDANGKERLNYPSRWDFPKKRNVCLTQGCCEAAKAVLKNMNKQADPCENFYEFACGNFIKETMTPVGLKVDIFSVTEDKVLDELIVILEDDADNSSADDEAKPFRMAKTFYKICMDGTKIDGIDLSYIKEIVQRMGGWPVLEGDRWDASKFTWKDTIYKFRDEGISINYLISFNIGPDLKNNTKFAIQLDQANLGIPRENLVRGMEENAVQNYYNEMIEIAVKFGADRDLAAKELKESLDLEIQLANISTPNQNRRNFYTQYSPLTILQLQERFPSIPWYEYISNILQKSTNVKPEEVVFVNDIPYINKLENILSTTPKRTQANYLMWRAVDSVVPYITAFRRTRPPQRDCARMAAEGLDLAVNALYVQRLFKQGTKGKASEMVDKFREEIYKTLTTTDWIDEKTRRNAVEKAEAMIPYIAYPDEILDVRKLEDIYHELEIIQGNYLEAKLNSTKFQQDFSFGYLKNTFKMTDWNLHSNLIKVNALNNLFINTLDIPAAILQRPFFSHDRPNYMNYGILGYVLGHEIIHGFDDQGREFDKDGNLNDWWDPEARKTYQRKAACLIDQYGNYTVEEVRMNLNGKNTLGENIADNGGVKLAYRAYNRWAEKHEPEKRLPGLREFTPQQMFWISAANTWCTKYNPAALKYIIESDVHPPGEFRVRGPFSNQPEFANDFKCPLGSKMNPFKKCQLW